MTAHFVKCFAFLLTTTSLRASEPTFKPRYRAHRFSSSAHHVIAPAKSRHSHCLPIRMFAGHARQIAEVTGRTLHAALAAGTSTGRLQGLTPLVSENNCSSSATGFGPTLLRAIRHSSRLRRPSPRAGNLAAPTLSCRPFSHSRCPPAGGDVFRNFVIPVSYPEKHLRSCYRNPAWRSQAGSSRQHRN